ncbi:MAG: efflux transporter outer membrane subunit [Novosphingobium sp.]|nr:efflux transporter outer membrane subunit [Novosphingobium sp.]
MIARKAILCAVLLPLAACDLAPKYVRPASSVGAVPPEWPQGAAYGSEQDGAAGMPWRSLVGDERLRTVIERALAGNRDLRAAVANVASARALYRAQRSQLAPTVTAGGSATAVRGGNAIGDSESYAADLGFSGFELDLFGRLRNESRQAFETYLATESGMRATRLMLVAETATAYATLAADADLLRIAWDTVKSGERSLQLTQALLRAGLGSAGDVQNAITVVEQARSDVQRYTAQVAQDRNALELLVGAPVEDGLLPVSLAGIDPAVANVPAGLSSAVLLQRPDVVEAEHALKAAYAQIGAARAAFFPTISLTSALGVASDALRTLFRDGAFNWRGTAGADVPVLGGPRGADLDYAKAQRELYLARYEKAIQSAFRDVADGLARRGTIVAQREAQAALVAAAGKSHDLALRRYRAGVGSFLEVLTAQRTLYAARQSEIAVALADVGNRIALYQALGSDDSL